MKITPNLIYPMFRIEKPETKAVTQVPSFSKRKKKTQVLSILFF